MHKCEALGHSGLVEMDAAHQISLIGLGPITRRVMIIQHIGPLRDATSPIIHNERRHNQPCNFYKYHKK